MANIVGFSHMRAVLEIGRVIKSQKGERCPAAGSLWGRWPAVVCRGREHVCFPRRGKSANPVRVWFSWEQSWERLYVPGVLSASKGYSAFPKMSGKLLISRHEVECQGSALTN
jgi:hypothetical protein